MSYGIGGYTVLVDRSALTPVRLTVEEALRFSVTAGASAKDQEAPGGQGGDRAGSRSAA